MASQQYVQWVSISILSFRYLSGRKQCSDRRREETTQKDCNSMSGPCFIKPASSRVLMKRSVWKEMSNHEIAFQKQLFIPSLGFLHLLPYITGHIKSKVLKTTLWFMRFLPMNSHRCHICFSSSLSFRILLRSLSLSLSLSLSFSIQHYNWSNNGGDDSLWLGRRAGLHPVLESHYLCSENWYHLSSPVIIFALRRSPRSEVTFPSVSSRVTALRKILESNKRQDWVVFYFNLL